MNGIIFTPRANSPGKRDYTGAFRPEARRYADNAGIDREAIYPIRKRRRKAMREEVVHHLGDTGLGNLWDTVAFFCHGYPSGIQLGFSLREVEELAEAISDNSETDVTVLLYCCSTANSRQVRSVGGDGGFADALRDALCVHGCGLTKVVSHVTVGHTTRNPHVRFFYGNGSEVGGTGGMYVVEPGGPLWASWAKWLKQGNNRFAFPYMERDEIVVDVCSV